MRHNSATKNILSREILLENIV